MKTNCRCLSSSVTHPWQRRTSGPSEASGTQKGAPSHSATIDPFDLKTERRGRRRSSTFRSESLTSRPVQSQSSTTSTAVLNYLKRINCPASWKMTLNLSAAGQQLLIFRVTIWCNSRLFCGRWRLQKKTFYEDKNKYRLKKRVNLKVKSYNLFKGFFSPSRSCPATDFPQLADLFRPPVCMSLLTVCLNFSAT